MINNLLEYPFDSKMILRKRRAIKRELTGSPNLIEKRIAILGGSTTHDIREILELFLLKHGISSRFYESEYGRFWEDAMFGQEELLKFQPDIIYIHTSNRNISAYPVPGQTEKEINQLLEEEYTKYESMWNKLNEDYHCPIIQNNFELPYYRLLGNQDGVYLQGRVNYISRLNMKIYEYAQKHDHFFINDIHYQSADYGLKEWSDPFYWYMYKYALCINAIPTLAFHLSNIIKSIFGKNKKALALDLDNTLWGGIVGDDGAENLVLGEETAVGQAYTEFQTYLKQLQSQGILLNVLSKNEEENAVSGLNHPQMVIKPEDFLVIRANWEPKSVNLTEIAKELNLLPEAFVFVDDNPAEREIVRQQVPGAAVPEICKPEHSIYAIDRGGYFETTVLSADDLKRNEMYRENRQREKQKQSFSNYKEYLLSLNMAAEIAPFQQVYMARIAQLTNKSNQFNLTTRRFTQKEIEQLAARDDYITLYGKVTDCFGDNGVVSLVIGRVEKSCLHIELWLMSCRVLKRDLEYAMMDELAGQCLGRNIDTIYGYYYPTSKNGMVRNFYETQGFSKEEEDSQGNSRWIFHVTPNYEKKNTVIRLVKLGEHDE